MKKTKVRVAHTPTSSAHEDVDGEEKPNILQLPEHITAHIFCKSPVTTLVRCFYVCKAWRRLLSDAHLARDLFSPIHSCLLLCGITNFPLLLDLDRPSSAKVVTLKVCEAPNLKNCGVHIVGSCHGLLCQKLCNRFKISNPITGEFLALPTPNQEFPDYCGFGFSPISGVYKLVVFMFKGPHVGEVMVLTVGTSGNWRSLGNFDLPCGHQTNGVYLNGSLHWVGQRSQDSSFCICAFDVEGERFEQLLSPPCPVREAVSVGVLRGSLSLAVSTSRTTLSIWVMKDYGVKESWTKEHEIFGVDSYSLAPVLLDYTEEGQVLLLHRFKLHAYNPETRELVKVQVSGAPTVINWACSHSPSFSLLKDIIRGYSLEMKRYR